jgi:hypothetical protein
MEPEPDEDRDAAWSSARTELLRQHYDLGLSAEFSARLIGNVSRNAVISKRRRLGLFGANPLRSLISLARGCAEPQARFEPRPRRVPVQRDERDKSNARLRALPFMDWPPPPAANPKVLADRSRGECAWPLGPAEASGDFRTLFCCAPIATGQRYCGSHQAHAYTDAIPPALQVCPGDRDRKRR